MPPLLNVTWQKNSQNNEWFDLLRLNLDAPYFKERKGVFMIWYTSSSGAKVIKVGSGLLEEQLKNLRANPSILQYSRYGTLKVAWVSVNGTLKEEQMSGVEAYLHNSYAPLVLEGKPSAPPIPISLL